MLTVDAYPECRVFIREMSREDVDAMAGWPSFTEPEFLWANLKLFSTRDRDSYFANGGSNETRRRFVIVDRLNRIVGTVGLRDLNLAAGEGTLGIIVRADVVGRGYGTDAIRNILHFAFHDLGLRLVKLDVSEGNLRARRCYESLGFSETGRRAGLGGGAFVDMVIYSQTFALVEKRNRLWLEPVRALP